MDFLNKITSTILRAIGKEAEGTTQAPSMGTAQPDVADLPQDTEAQRIVREICAQAIEAAQGNWKVQLSSSARWQALKDEPEALQIEVMLAAIPRHNKGAACYTGRVWQVEELRRAIVGQTLRRKLSFPESALAAVLSVWHDQAYSLDYGLPGRSILGAVEALASERPLGSPITQLLRAIRHRAEQPSYPGQRPNKAMVHIIERIDALLNPGTVRGPTLPKGAFADRFIDYTANLTPQMRDAWMALGILCAEAADKAKPSGKWLTKASDLIEPLRDMGLSAKIQEWLDSTVPDPTAVDDSLDILKGLIWASTTLPHDEMAGTLGRFAETSFRKVPSWGARSVKLGNAALWALSTMAGHPHAAAELFRLREKIKYPSARKVLDGRLAELARHSGQTLEAMEDQALPDFGLSGESTLRLACGASHAEVSVLANETLCQWFNAVGKAVKAPPGEVKADHKEALVAARQAIKAIEAARATQVVRLEQSWIEERVWTFAEWQVSFFNHPLRRPIVEALLWSVGDQVVLPRAGQLQDVHGAVVTPVSGATVRLWHPLHSTPEVVLAWRQRILDLGLTQPIKQTHREIYVVTDAELQTATYSNRFAAHILRQHQFRALCQARGWRYDLMGGWDNWNMPTKVLPKQDITVEYLVEVVDDGQRSDAWVALHLASDQVRFLDRHQQAIALDQLRPVLFSEVMRDVDLFVAVTSVANDPGWTDGGPEGRHGGYWREWAFGELGQSASTRRELISWLRPKLSIADKLEITDKFLIVTGKRQSYAIHFGSSNIQIRPRNRYLCIVPDRPPAEAQGIKLPFAGDGLLSTILAKAFLLVDEDKIKDQTILRQL